MAIHDTIIERHICTSEWAMSNILPSKGAGPLIPREVLLLPPGRGDGVGGCAQKLIVIPEMAMGATPLMGSGITINF
jgi:hypothetical protein